MRAPGVAQTQSQSSAQERAEFLTARRLGRRFRGAFAPIDALIDIDLSLRAGERVAVTGQSGSGKSTLLALLGGIDRPTSGEIIVEGQPLGALGSQELAAYRNRTVGIVFQSARLLGYLSALENVALPLALAGVAAGERVARAAALLERVGLAERARHLPAELSGGEQQRVALARALANRPRLLVADEPTGSLDRVTAERLADWLFQLADEDRLTLVLATHDPGLAHRCDNRLELDHGRLMMAEAA